MGNKVFLTYSGNHHKINDGYLALYRDSLIFDKDRRSIYTQGQEFGYICNTQQEFTVKTPTNDSTTFLLNVENGIISIDEYVPVKLVEKKILNDNAIITSSANIEIGSTITVGDYIAKFSGTMPVTHTSLTFTDPNKNVTYIYGSSECLKNSNIEPNTSINYMNFAGVTSTTYNALSPNKTIAFTFYGKDDRMYENKNKPESLNNWATGSITITWLNQCAYGYVEIDNLSNLRLTKENLTSIMQNTTQQDLSTNGKWNLIYTALLNDYSFGEKTITCTNGKNTHFWICVPTRLVSGKNQLIAKFNGSAEVTLVKVNQYSNGNYVGNDFEYTNKSGYEENYSMFIANGENWNGSKIYIKK